MEDEYNSYNQVSTDKKFVGQPSDLGEPAYYDTESHSVQTGYLGEDDEAVPAEEGESWELDAEQELGEFLETVGEDHGWESLSEFARDHLEHEEASPPESATDTNR